MYPRTNYEMTQADLDGLLEQMKPVPYLVIGGRAPESQQERANRAWAALGAKMGFNGDTVEPRPGMGMLHFTAIPSETPEARAEREKAQAEAQRLQDIQALETEISAKQRKLEELRAATP